MSDGLKPFRCRYCTFQGQMPVPTISRHESGTGRTHFTSWGLAERSQCDIVKGRFSW
jgi:hypothetical protein